MPGNKSKSKSNFSIPHLLELKTEDLIVGEPKMVKAKKTGGSNMQYGRGKITKAGTSYPPAFYLTNKSVPFDISSIYNDTKKDVISLDINEDTEENRKIIDKVKEIEKHILDKVTDYDNDVSVMIDSNNPKNSRFYHTELNIKKQLKKDKKEGGKNEDIEYGISGCKIKYTLGNLKLYINKEGIITSKLIDLSLVEKIENVKKIKKNNIPKYRECKKNIEKGINIEENQKIAKQLKKEYKESVNITKELNKEKKRFLDPYKKKGKHIFGKNEGYIAGTQGDGGNINERFPRGSEVERIEVKFNGYSIVSNTLFVDLRVSKCEFRPNEYVEEVESDIEEDEDNAFSDDSDDEKEIVVEKKKKSKTKSKKQNTKDHKELDDLDDLDESAAFEEQPPKRKSKKSKKKKAPPPPENDISSDENDSDGIEGSDNDTDED